MRRSLSSLFLIHQAIANNLGLMNPQGQGDTLDSSGVFLPGDLLAGTPSNQLTTPAWTSERTSNSEPGLQQTSIKGPELPLFAAAIANCNSGIEDSQDQTFTPNRSRRSFTRFNKRRIPDFCVFQPLGRPFVAPQKLEEGISDPSNPSPEIPGPGYPGKSNSAPQVGPLKGPGSNEEIRALIYLFPGTNGEPNTDACDILLKPLHKVPICATPHPSRDSFADIVSPARLCEFWFPKCSSPLHHTSHIEGTDTFLLRQLQICLSTLSEIRRLKILSKAFPQTYNLD